MYLYKNILVVRTTNNSALRKHQFYHRLYQPSGPDTQLVIFAFETSGSIHPEARKFLRDHVAAGTTHNPGLDSSGEVCSHCTHATYPR